MTGDGIPDLINTCFSNIFGRVKAIFAIRGKGKNTFYSASILQEAKLRENAMLFYTLIEPEKWDAVKISPSKDEILIKDIDNQIIEVLDFSGNLYTSPFFKKKDSEKGKNLKILFYYDYFLLKEKIKKAEKFEGKFFSAEYFVLSSRQIYYIKFFKKNL